MTAQEMADRWRRDIQSGEAARRFAAGNRLYDGLFGGQENRLKQARESVDKSSKQPKA